MQIGPLANSRRIDTMETFVADAKSKGARVLAGGSRISNRGYFFSLTVLADVLDNARAMNEKPFGPLPLVSPCALWMRQLRRPIRCLTASPPMPLRARRTMPTVWPMISRLEI
jgi:Aldehyde dehydrogenase family